MLVNLSSTIVKTSDDQEKLIGSYNGKVLLIVNLASKCGYTRQYAGLQKLYETYSSRGFEILGFPCNNFGSQEPGSIEEIKQFCTNNYNVTFEIFNKVNAVGNTNEPYTTLKKFIDNRDVKWNFEKFLVGKDGNVIECFPSNTEPESAELISAIDAALSF